MITVTQAITHVQRLFPDFMKSIIQLLMISQVELHRSKKSNRGVDDDNELNHARDAPDSEPSETWKFFDSTSSSNCDLDSVSQSSSSAHEQNAHDKSSSSIIDEESESLNKPQ